MPDGLLTRYEDGLVDFSEASLGFAAELGAFAWGQAVRIETVAIVQLQEVLQREAKVFECGFLGRAGKPFGKRLAGLAGQTARGKFFLKLIKFGIEAGPDNDSSILGRSSQVASASLEDDAVEEQG